MKLYYSPGACSLASHIVAREAAAAVEIESVKLDAARKTETGADYFSINPKGAVPALDIGGGQVLTEGAIIMQYIVGQSRASALLPADGPARWRVLEMTNYIATEVHKGFSPLFNPSFPADGRAVVLETLKKKFDYLEKTLTGKSYLTGEDFTIADAYAFTVLNWTSPLKIDLAPWPNITAYRTRILERPAVRQAMQEEGLLKAA